MYQTKPQYFPELLNTTSGNYPKRKVIQEYMNGSRMAQENTVRALAAHLRVNNWRDLVL